MVDRFTKGVLVVIAICLTFLCIRTFRPIPASAVRETAIRVDLVKVGGVPVYWKDIKELPPARRMSEQD